MTVSGRVRLGPVFYGCLRRIRGKAFRWLHSSSTGG